MALATVSSWTAPCLRRRAEDEASAAAAVPATLPVALWLSNVCFNVCSRWAVPLWQLKDGASCRELVLGEATGLRALEVVPPNVQEDRVLVYFHGGAHLIFSPYTHRELVGRVAATARARVLAVDYRKAPDSPFPAGLDDAFAAWEWAQKAYPSAKVAVGGDSAGGNLVFALLMKLAASGLPQPVAAFGFSPWLLMHAGEVRSRTPEALQPKFSRWHRHAEWAADLYLAGHPAEDALASPALASEALAAALPPMLIHAARGEALAVDAQTFEALCRRAGAPLELRLFEGVPHVFQSAPLLWPSANRESFKALEAFLDRHMGSPAVEASSSA